jgi:predicted amidophosphoribosyltransferase
LSVVWCTLSGVWGLLDLVVPGRCAGCAAPGPALCDGCRAVLREVPARARLPGVPVYALGRYHGALRAAVLAYKERGRRELARPFGTALAAALLTLPDDHDRTAGTDAASDRAASDWAVAAVRGAAGARASPSDDGVVWLVPVPSRPAAVRRRGVDHVRVLAGATAAVLAARGIPAAVAPALRVARGARDSVGLDAAARAANLSGRIRPRTGGLPPPGTAVVLLDDVVTTGATTAACARALAAAGIRVQAALVLASASPLLHSGALRNHSVTVGAGPRTAEFKSA